MLIVTLTTVFVLIFLGGGGSDVGLQLAFQKIAPFVEENVKDAERAERASGVAQQLNDELESFLAALEKDRKTVQRVDADYNATDAEIRKSLEGITVTWKRFEKSSLDLRFELKETLTREEWTALFEELESTVE